MGRGKKKYRKSKRVKGRTKKKIQRKKRSRKNIVKAIKLFIKKNRRGGGNIFEVCIFKMKYVQFPINLVHRYFYPLKTPVGGYIFLSNI